MTEVAVTYFDQTGSANTDTVLRIYADVLQVLLDVWASVYPTSAAWLTERQLTQVRADRDELARRPGTTSGIGCAEAVPER